MAALTTALLIGGLAISAAGAAVSYSAQRANARAQADASNQALAFQQQIEAKRQQQMNLDASRRQREITRQRIAARAQALAATTAQGASGGSALEGAYGGISGRSNVNALGISQNQEIGNSIFSLNSGVLGAYRAGATAAGNAASLGALGSGLSSFGNAMMRNDGAISRVGSFLSGSRL